jgi:hypothetical protein
MGSAWRGAADEGAMPALRLSRIGLRYPHAGGPHLDGRGSQPDRRAVRDQRRGRTGNTRNAHP